MILKYLDIYRAKTRIKNNKKQCPLLPEKSRDGWDPTVVPTLWGLPSFSVPPALRVGAQEWSEKHSSPATCSMLHSQSAPKVHQLIESHVVPNDSSRHQYPQIDQWHRTKWRYPGFTTTISWSSSCSNESAGSMGIHGYPTWRHHPSKWLITTVSM